MNTGANDLTTQRRGSSKWRRLLIVYLVIPVIAFLLGLVPMWWKGRSCANELASVQDKLLISSMQNSLANAASDARRGDYEPARQASSDFFTKLRAEADRGSASVFTSEQRSKLQPIFAERDNTVTLLARSDPASVDRLMDLYLKYRQVAPSTAH